MGCNTPRSILVRSAQHFQLKQWVHLRFNNRPVDEQSYGGYYLVYWLQYWRFRKQIEVYFFIFYVHISFILFIGWTNGHFWNLKQSAVYFNIYLDLLGWFNIQIFFMTVFLKVTLSCFTLSWQDYQKVVMKHVVILWIELLLHHETYRYCGKNPYRKRRCCPYCTALSTSMITMKSLRHVHHNENYYIYIYIYIYIYQGSQHQI